MAILGSPSLTVLMVSVDVKQHLRKQTEKKQQHFNVQKQRITTLEQAGRIYKADNCLTL